MIDWQAAQQNLLEELKTEEDRKLKKTLRNRNRRQKAKKLEISDKEDTPPELPAEPVKTQPPKACGNLKVPAVVQPCLADLLQTAEIDVFLLREELAAKNLEISNVQNELKLAKDKMTEVTRENENQSRALSEPAPLTRDEGLKQVELLRREITQVDHQRLRFKANHEIASLAKLDGLKEEISMLELKRNQVAAKMAAQRKTSSEERRNFQAAQGRVDREREKLVSLLKSLGVTNMTRELTGEEISDIAADRDRKIAEEKKVVIAMCNEELEKVNKRIELITREVPKILMNGGLRGKANDAAVELARTVLQRATKH